MPTRLSSPQNLPAKGILADLHRLPVRLVSTDQAETLDKIVHAIQKLPRAARISIIKPASAKLVQIVDATTSDPKGKKHADAILFALKILAHMGTREGTQAIIRTAKKGFAPDEYLWSVALRSYGQGHVGASLLFGELGKKLPEKFLGICLLDAANEACREHGLKKHPFDSKAGQQRLQKLLGSTRADSSSYAVSACAALPFISPARRKPLIARARKHKNADIRLEVAWAIAKLDEKAGIDYLIEMCSDVNQSVQAREYLREIGKRKLIPKSALAPDFAAMAEMANWLKHPNEFGESPDRIRVMDARKLYWPPQRKELNVHLICYEYDKCRALEKKVVGVGMVGSTTFALFDTTKPTMKPEQIYGLHCSWELQAFEDPRAPKSLSAKEGWRLIQSRA